MDQWREENRRKRERLNQMSEKSPGEQRSPRAAGATETAVDGPVGGERGQSRPPRDEIARSAAMAGEDACIEERRDEQGESEVGITNTLLEEEDRNEEITATRRRGQERGDMRTSTHQGTTSEEQEDPVLDVEPGSEAERGAKIADKPKLG